MRYEYEIEYFSLEVAPFTGNAPPESQGRVYACGEAGECVVRDVREEQLEHLQGFMNEMGSKGWELVQILFNRKGAVTFWKRAVED